MYSRFLANKKLKISDKFERKLSEHDYSPFNLKRDLHIFSVNSYSRGSSPLNSLHFKYNRKRKSGKGITMNKF